MRIALDIRPLQNASAGRGVGRYVRALIAHMPEGADEFLYLESRWLPPGEIPATWRGRRLRLTRPARAITVFDQIATPWLCARRKVDLFHSTFYALPAWKRASVRSVLTVHDLIPLVLPGAVGRKNTAIFRQIYLSARRADAVITPSARTAYDLEQRIGVPRARIHVIPMGVGAPFGEAGIDPRAREEHVRDHRAIQQGALSRLARTQRSGSRLRDEGGAHLEGSGSRYGPIERMKAGGARVLVYAGGFDATKNVPFLFQMLKALEAGPVGLCLAGETGRSGGALREEVTRLGLLERVLFLGRISDEDLAAAYRSADVFVSASLYEGFGLPALEAMACACPVVALSAGTVPEVLAGAAMAIEDKDPAAFAAGVERVLEDASLREGMITRGLARAANLSWQRTAAATSALYHELGEARKR